MARFDYDAQYVPKVPRCTIIVDSSSCPDTGACGFSAWCAGSNGKGRVGGAVIERVKGSTNAEIVGACNAMYMAIEKGYIQKGMQVLLQIDNLDAIRMYDGTNEPSNAVQEKAKRHFDDWVDRYDLEMVIKHIKGHSREDQNRFYAHNLCDEEAKAYMRTRRSQLRLEDCKNLHGIGREKAPEKVDACFKRRTEERVPIDHLEQQIAHRNANVRNKCQPRLAENFGYGFGYEHDYFE